MPAGAPAIKIDGSPAIALDLKHLRAAVEALDDDVVPVAAKGLPRQLGGVRFRDVVGMQVAGDPGPVPAPFVTLSQSAIEGNARHLQAMCDARGVLFAPHGKTTMAPRLFLSQLAAGAWAITIATRQQLDVCRRFEVPRVLWANEPVTRDDFDAIAAAIASGMEVFTLVDTEETATRLGEDMGRRALPIPLGVLVEVGWTGGRSGHRGGAQAVARVARVVQREPSLRFVGIEGYEGSVSRADSNTERAAVIGAFLAHLAEVAISARAWVEAKTLMVSAGGTAHLDQALALLGDLPGTQFIARSGQYLISGHEPHGADSGRLTTLLAGLRPAARLWATVISRPEPGMAIVGIGRRDFGTDAGLPIALETLDPMEPVDGFRSVAAYDQHLCLEVPTDSGLGPGSTIVFGISHPCTLMDKWAHMLQVSDETVVTSVIRTFF